MLSSLRHAPCDSLAATGRLAADHHLRAVRLSRTRRRGGQCAVSGRGDRQWCLRNRRAQLDAHPGLLRGAAGELFVSDRPRRCAEPGRDHPLGHPRLRIHRLYRDRDDRDLVDRQCLELPVAQHVQLGADRGRGPADRSDRDAHTPGHRGDDRRVLRGLVLVARLSRQGSATDRHHARCGRARSDIPGRAARRRAVLGRIAHQGPGFGNFGRRRIERQ